MWDDLCNRWCFIVSAVELVAAYNDHGKQMKQWALNDEAKGLCFTVGQTRNKRKNFESGYWPSQPVCQVHEQGSTQLGRFGHVVAFVTALVQENLGIASFSSQHTYGESFVSLWMRSKIYWCTVNHFSTNAAALSYSCIHVKKLLHPPSVSLACHLQLLLPRHVFLLSWSSHSKP